MITAKKSTISYILLLFFTISSLLEVQIFAKENSSYLHIHPDESLNDIRCEVKRYSKPDLEKAFGKKQAKKIIQNNIYALELRLKNEGKYKLQITDLITNLKQIPENQLKKLFAVDGFSKFLQIMGTLLCGSILFPFILMAVPLLTLCAIIPLCVLTAALCPPLGVVMGVLGFAAVACSPFLVTHSILSVQLEGVFNQLPTVNLQYPITLNPGQDFTQLLFVRSQELLKPYQLMILNQQESTAFTGYIS